MVTPDTNGWTRAELFVKETLDRHTDQIDRIQRDVAKINSRLAALGVKVALVIGVGMILASAVATAIARSWGG